MKNKALTVVVILILGLSIYNAWKDDSEMHEHHQFFEEMRGFKKSLEDFKNKGGRNTAAQGRALCARINELERVRGLEPVNCNKIYR